MKKNDLGILKSLWEMRKLTVEGCISNISTNSELQFLLSVMGIWFFVRLALSIWIGAHVLYLVFRIFNMVLG